MDQGAVRCTRTNQVALSVPDPPTFAVATQAPHREVGSNYRLIVSLRAIPTGAVALRSIPLSCSGCPSHLGPCLPVIASSQATTLTSRPSSAVESVAVHRCDPTFRPWLPWASCSSSEGGGVPQSHIEPGKPGRQEPVGWNCETARGPSLPECFRGPVPRRGWTAVGSDSPWTEVRGSTIPSTPRLPTSNRSSTPSVSGCCCTRLVSACLPHPTRHRGDASSAAASVSELRSITHVPKYFRRELPSVWGPRLPAGFPKESWFRSGPRGVSFPREGPSRR